MRDLIRRLIPFGARRALWRVRRSVPRIAQPLSLVVRAGPPERPILIVGCPRSAGPGSNPFCAPTGTIGCSTWFRFRYPKTMLKLPSGTRSQPS